MKHLFFLTCISSIIGFSTYNFQTTSIQGKVTDAKSGEAIIFGSIALYQNGTFLSDTETDFDGNYFFNDIKAGSKYDIEITYDGYTVQKIENIIVKDSDVTIVDVQLSQGITLDEIQVIGYKVPLIEADKNTNDRGRKRKMTSEEIKSLPVINIGDIATATKTHYYIDGVRVKNKKVPNRRMPSLPFQTMTKEEVTKDSIYLEVNEENTGIKENNFKSPLGESFSTFSLDVDRASYSNIRRYINDLTLPPTSAVRVEEMINYFNYDYPQAKDKHPLNILPTFTECPWNDNHRLLHIAVKGKEVSTKKLPQSNLVFLIDVSGSMNAQNKLPLVISSFELLLEELRPNDRVSIVTYAGRDQVVLASTPAANKKTIITALNNLNSGGGTAGAAGINTAYEIAEKNFIKDGNNRVILATDGDFNIGVRSATALEELIEKKRESGIFLSVLGFGTGNYRDHKMQTLADKGNGNHGYIDNIKEAKKMFINEFEGTLFTIAKDVKIQIEFNPAYVQGYRLIGYENRMLAKEDFIDDSKDAGEVGSGHTVTAIYEIIPAGTTTQFEIEIDSILMKDNRVAKQASSNGKVAYIKCRYKQPDDDKSVKFERQVGADISLLKHTNDDIRFSIAVADFGMQLFGSSFRSNVGLENCIEMAQKSLGADKEGYREEFIELAKKANKLFYTVAFK